MKSVCSLSIVRYMRKKTAQDKSVIFSDSYNTTFFACSVIYFAENKISEEIQRIWKFHARERTAKDPGITVQMTLQRSAHAGECVQNYSNKNKQKETNKKMFVL